MKKREDMSQIGDNMDLSQPNFSQHIQAENTLKSMKIDINSLKLHLIKEDKTQEERDDTVDD